MNKKPILAISSICICGCVAIACQADDMPVERSVAAEDHTENAALTLPAETRAHIGFGAAIADADVSALARKYRVNARAAYMWAFGLTGTYRTYEDTGTGNLLNAARTSTIKSFETGLKKNAARARAFITSHDATEIEIDEVLATQARSLLDLSRQLEQALDAARSGSALVYSIEVLGEATALDALRLDPSVRAFAWSSPATAGPDDARRTTKPAAYNAAYETPGMTNLGSGELRAALGQFASKYEEVER